MRRLLLLLAALVCGFAHAVDYEFKTGDTSKLILVSMYKAADGTADTGLAYSSMTITYTRNNASADTDITEATMTMGTWASGGWVEVDATNTPGLYQFGIPDAALATGADNVVFSFKASGAVPKFIQASLVSVDFRGAAYIPANTVQIEGGDATNAINAEADTALADYDPPTNAEMVARTLPTASYFDPATDTVTTDSASRTASKADVSALATAAALATAQTDLDTITGSNGVTLATSQPNYAPATSTALATAQADLDTITGSDGVTLATSQPNYAPNKTTPPTVLQIRTEMETAGGSLALVLEDTGTTLPSTLSGLATSSALSTAQSDITSILGDTNELQTRFFNMIESDGPDWRFVANALEQAPAGGGGGDATEANQLDLIDKIKGLMSKDHTLATSVGTFDPSTDSAEAIRNRGDAAWVTGGGGAGAVTFEYTLTNSATSAPIDDALVEVFTEAAMTNRVAALRTDAFGKCTFYLDEGTYYLKRSKGGYNFTNPDVQVVEP